MDFEVRGGFNPTISHIELWRLALKVDHLNWITGLETPAAEGGAFTRRRVDSWSRADHNRIEGPLVGTGGAVFWLDGAGDGAFFGGVLWSGAWSLAVSSDSARAHVGVQAAELSTTLRDDRPPLEMPMHSSASHRVMSPTSPGRSPSSSTAASCRRRPP